MLKQQMAPARLVEDRAGSDQGQSCLAGLYLLTERGALARIDADGEPVVDQALTRQLAFRLQAVLDQYRSGALDALSVGLIMDTELAERRSAGAMIFSDRVLDALPGEGGQWGRMATTCQGIELLLNGSGYGGPPAPAFCPVLFVPEVDDETLRERYGVDFALSRHQLEVLDLFALSATSSHNSPELLSLAEAMRRGRGAAPVSTRDNSEAAPDPIARYCAELTANPPHDSCLDEGDVVTGWLLEWFSPFNELTDTQREIIAGYETIRKACSGTRLIERRSRDDLCIYLVEGSLLLEGADGGSMTVKAGTRRSRLPISVLTPHAYEVTALTDASYIAFSQQLVRRIIEIATTYTSVDPGTAAISNGVQSVYLNPAFPQSWEPVKPG